MCIGTHIYIYIYTHHICMYVCVYIYIYTQALILLFVIAFIVYVRQRELPALQALFMAMKEMPGQMQKLDRYRATAPWLKGNVPPRDSMYLSIYLYIYIYIHVCMYTYLSIYIYTLVSKYM